MCDIKIREGCFFIDMCVEEADDNNVDAGDLIVLIVDLESKAAKERKIKLKALKINEFKGAK